MNSAQMTSRSQLMQTTIQSRSQITRSVVKCRCGPANMTTDGPSEALPRRVALGALVAIGAAVFGPTQEALAFGSGIPGYDVNMDARKRAQARIKAEMKADLDRGKEISFFFSY